AAKETVLYNFANTTLDGTFPEASVLLDNAGDLYGTTWIGGYADVGVVFKLSATGKERRLYSFLGADDGGTPIADLVRDAAGNLYGTTSQYGAYGQGTVFEILAAQGSSHRDR